MRWSQDFEANALCVELREQSARLVTPEIAEALRGQHDLPPGLDAAGLPNTGSTNVAFVVLPAA